jgi:AhpD family alkylhydroperoxidase
LDNREIKSDVSRRGFAFVSGMTLPFDMAILNMLISSSSPYFDCLGLSVPVMKFNKRTYKNLRELFSDLWFPIKNRKRLKEVTNRGLISPAFRERLMLAVIAVEGCRYCSYFHAKQALKSGVTPEEITRLLSGDIDNCPEEEAVAVIYAQHWAESDAHPDHEAVSKLQRTYGVEKEEAIHLMLRMIRLGNLLGNSWDYLLYRMSFGKWRK